MLKTSHPEWTKQYSEGKVLHIELTDATGRMLKDTLFIYINDIKNLVLNFSTIEVSDALNVNSLNLTLAAGSRGKMNLSANLLEVNIGAGSKLTLSGDIKSIVGKVEGNSHLKGNNLIVLNTNLKVKGNSTADIKRSPLPSEKNEGISTLTFCFLVTVFIISILSFYFTCKFLMVQRLMISREKLPCIKFIIRLLKPASRWESPSGTTTASSWRNKKRKDRL